MQIWDIILICMSLQTCLIQTITFLINVAMGIKLPEEFNPNGGNNLTMISDRLNSLIHHIFHILTYVEQNQQIYNDGTRNIYIMMFQKNTRITLIPFKKQLPILVQFSGRNSDVICSIIAPILIASGLTLVISTLIVVPIIDIQGPIRSYMVSFDLQVLTYQIDTFDFVFWIIEVFIVWALFIITDVNVF